MDTESRAAVDPATTTATAPSLPTAVDRDTFQAQLDNLRLSLRLGDEALGET